MNRTDHVRLVIDAVHDDAPNFSQISAEALRAIDSEIERLTADRDLIRQLAGRFASPQANVVPESVAIVKAHRAPTGNGLTPAQKNEINRIIDEFLAIDIAADTTEIVNSLERQLGVDLGMLTLSQPRSVLGTMIHFRRERLKRSAMALNGTAPTES
jgi:hypothetical protein